MDVIQKREVVVDLINLFRPRRVAEVGVWRGRLSKLIAQQCDSVERLLLVDPWAVHELHGTTMNEGTPTAASMDEMYADVARWARSVRTPTIEVVRTTSEDASSAAPTLDFVFLDAIHDYENTRADIRAWKRTLRPGGVLAGDDYRPRFPGLIRAVDELLPERRVSAGIWWAEV